MVWIICKLGCGKCSLPNNFYYKARSRQVFCILYVLVTVQHFFQLIWTILCLVGGPGLIAYSFTLPDFSLKRSGKPRDTRRHLYFTPKLQTFSSLQHLLAYRCNCHNQLKISDLLLPGVKLNVCASIDIMSPLSPCTNRASNALTVCATQTQCSEWQDKNTASAPAYSSMNICVHALNTVYFTAYTW